MFERYSVLNDVHISVFGSEMLNIPKATYSRVNAYLKPCELQCLKKFCRIVALKNSNPSCCSFILPIILVFVSFSNRDPPPILKPQNLPDEVHRNWKPQIGMVRATQVASLGMPGHRMLRQVAFSFASIRSQKQ